jgi:DNA mismatch endonuclease, patch repair protein
MVANRSRDTRPEVALRRTLYLRGLRYRKNYRLSVGSESVRPDIVFIGARVAVFVDGCFWHGCSVHRTVPRLNRSFWEKKLRANSTRDRRQGEALASEGWIVLRVWEHDATPDAAARVVAALMAAQAKC